MKLDDNSFREHTTLKYPYLYVEKLTDAMAVLIYSIPDGNLPITVTVSGKLCTIATKTFDPYHLKLFIDTYKPTLHISKENEKKLNTIYEYLEEVKNLCLE